MKLGVQFKLLLLLGFFALVFLGAIAYGLSGVRQIAQASREITREEIPLARGIQEALVTLLEGKGAFEAILQTSEFEELSAAQGYEAELFGAIAEFGAYTSAITWGSGSEAFLKSDGGLNAKIWNRLSSTADLLIQQPGVEQAQRAGLADLYFGGFAQNALKAASAHKRFLRLDKTQTEEAQRLRQETKEYADRAARFSQLTAASLSEIVRISQTNVRRSEHFIENVRQEVRNRMIIVFMTGSALSLFMGWFLVRKGIVDPLAEANRRLKEILLENDETAKMLVRRDLELTGSNERLQELDEAKSQFVSVAAHQLRTPLSGIKWTLYTLFQEEAGALNEEQKKLAKDAYKANDRLIGLIRALLDVARLEEGRFGFDLSKQAFLPIVKEVKKKFQKQAQEKGVALRMLLPEEKLPPLLLDREKMEIALENFVDNAVKYTPPKGKVTIRVMQEKERLVLEIQDTGIGIPRQEISRLFTKFFRGTNAQLLQTSGTGLGLYLAKNIIEHHRGTVYVESEEQKGTTISVSLPIPSSKNT